MRKLSLFWEVIEERKLVGCEIVGMTREMMKVICSGLRSVCDRRKSGARQHFFCVASH